MTCSTWCRLFLAQTAGAAEAAANSAPPRRYRVATPNPTGVEFIDHVVHWIVAHELLVFLFGLFATILLCFLTYFITRRVLVRSIEFLVHRTAAKWDDALVESGLFRRLAYLAPAVVVFQAGYLLSPAGQSNVQRMVLGVVAGILGWAINGFVTAINRMYELTPRARELPIKGYLQIVQILNVLVVTIVAISVILDQSPWALLSGLGALTAIVLLIFKDTILSFIASIQLATNDMVRIGDWISMPKFSADGDVIEMALHTVKVQNWDKTITTIPTYALISEPFKNWRGMKQSGGRRIKRAILIDQTSVRFLDEPAFARLAKVKYLATYMQERRAEIETHNLAMGLSIDDRVSGRAMTNLGTFRMYLVHWLRAHPRTHPELTFLVRQLEPGPTGLPLEVYLFSNDQVWANYEAIQADIFDHILAILPEFGLRVFQYPSGYDMSHWRAPS
ncbi:MAG: mechanosensitive ion channel [Deltaproteobacteria bacterium]|nr:mechanosensitive ion channel [Deltaproteobacteria bacterium]